MVGGLFPMHMLGANLTDREVEVIVVFIPALFSFLAVLYTRKTAKQMRPNGGSSFRDAIDKLAEQVKERDAKFDRHQEILDQRLTLLEDYITNPPKGHPYS